MQLIAQNLVFLISKFNIEDLSIDSLRNILGEMPTIQTPSFPSGINVPLPINLPTTIEFQSSGTKIVAFPDRVEIMELNETVITQQNFSGKVKLFLESMQKDYHINAFGFNFDFTLPCKNNLKQMMEISTKLTNNHQDNIMVSQIRFRLVLEDVLYIIDFNESLPNLNVHVNCHFERQIRSSDLAGAVEQYYKTCYQQALQLIQNELGD